MTISLVLANKVPGEDTLTANVLVVLAVPSSTTTEMVGVPAVLPTLVTWIERFPSDPPKTMFALGMINWLSEDAVTIKLRAAVSTSPTVKRMFVLEPPIWMA